MERDFLVPGPDTQWATDITYIHTVRGWLYPCTVLDLFNGKVVRRPMSGILHRHLLLSAMLMAC